MITYKSPVDFRKWAFAHLVKKQPTGFKVRPDEPEPFVHDDGSIVTLRNANTNECRWMPSGVPNADAQLCGHKTVNGSSWCKHHRGRVFPYKAQEVN